MHHDILRQTVRTTMDTTMIVGLITILVVGFFAYQWWSRTSKASRYATNGKATVPLLSALAPAPAAPPAPSPASSAHAQQEQKYPEVAGQTENELRAKEPIQRPVAATPQNAVMNDGTGPAEFGDSLRRPEQAYYQPSEARGASQTNDVASGRAAAASTPLSGHQQAFKPEMAQNGGALIGNSVFAYDGMEPTEFADF